MSASQSRPAKRMLSVQLRDRNALNAAYTPFLENGGLFIPSSETYELGEEVFVLLSLLDEPEKLPVAGRIVWITPKGAAGNRTPGIGIHFSGQDGGRLRNKIETLMAGALNQDKPTHTL